MQKSDSFCYGSLSFQLSTQLNSTTLHSCQQSPKQSLAPKSLLFSGHLSTSEFHHPERMASSVLIVRSQKGGTMNGSRPARGASPVGDLVGLDGRHHGDLVPRGPRRVSAEEPRRGGRFASWVFAREEASRFGQTKGSFPGFEMGGFAVRKTLQKLAQT